MNTFKFYKEHDHRWYVDLPDYPGDKAELEMVLGADQLLELYAQGDYEIELTISTVAFEGADVMERIKFGLPSSVDPTYYTDEEANYGATYKVGTIKHIPFNLEFWLCPVTTYVFGEYPEKLYING